MHKWGTMFAKSFFYGTLGLVLGTSLTGIAHGLTISETAEIQNLQESSLKLQGDYYSDTKNQKLQVHTYTKLCKGYVIIEETPTQIIATGYGEASDDYTYKINKPLPLDAKSATTTNEKPLTPMDTASPDVITTPTDTSIDNI